MTRPRPAAVLLIVSLAVFGGAATAIVLAGPSASPETVGNRPRVDSESAQGTENTASATSTAAKQKLKESKLKEQNSGNRQRGTSRATRKPGDREPAAAAVGGIRIDATSLPVRNTRDEPTRILIPTIGIRAEIDPVGLTARNEVDVPSDVGRIGWYRHSQAIHAQRGSTVLVGHRDGKGQGPGAFYRIGELNVGDEITVVDKSEKEVVYQVVAREAFNKERVPLRDLFTSLGVPRLTLITCGGPFDPTQLGYTDNVVVTAVPLQR